MTTIGHRLDARGGIGPGFDLMRLVLAVGVVAWHIGPLRNPWHSLDDVPLAWLLRDGGLAAFFVLSGFLVAGSAQRLRTGAFVLNRALRIFPALVVEVVLSMLVIGPIFTTRSLSQYVGDGDTWRYLGNVLGLMQFRLPGVFSSHPLPVVNLTLWTVPCELICYGAMTVFIFTRALRYRSVMLAVGPALIGLGLALEASGVRVVPQVGVGSLQGLVADLFVGHASQLFVAFALGTAAYLYRYQVPLSRIGIGIAVATLAALSARPIASIPLANLLMLPPLVYLTVCIGVADVGFARRLRRRDYSYGIYLYGWPIQQAVYALSPGVHHPVYHFVVALPVIVLVAALSWHGVELPILAWRKRFSLQPRPPSYLPPLPPPAGQYGAQNVSS